MHMLFIAPLMYQPPAQVLFIPNRPVPFYSQFADIASPAWKKVACGVTSLAMVINYYSPGATTADSLLKQGIAAGAYDYSAGWTYAGLIGLAKHYGMTGQTHDYGKLAAQAAFAKFSAHLEKGPLIASVHYKFEPTNPIPHLVVIDRREGDVLYYNDPAASGGEKQISVADFIKAWKKRYIAVRPKGDVPGTTSV